MASSRRPRSTVGKGLASLKDVVGTGLADHATRMMAEGKLDEAYRLASAAQKGDVSITAKEALASIFYAHGKSRAAAADLQGALDDFRRASAWCPKDALFRARANATAAAGAAARKRIIRGSDGADLFLDDPVEIKRYDIISFANEVGRALNYSIREVSETPILDYLQNKHMLREASVDLAASGLLDSFGTVGVYRWQGDPQSADEFTGWIRRFKSGERGLGVHLARAMAEWIMRRTSLLQRMDVIVPVPGDPGRMVGRGYNPPGILSEVIGECLGVPIEDRALAKRGAPRARGLSLEEVANNFVGAPQHSSTVIPGRSVLLVDDVATRGFTLAACSLILRSLGATRVDTFVLAQSITSRRERHGRDWEP